MFLLVTEEEWLEKLKEEGFSDLRVVPIDMGEDPEHVHPFHTVNVILGGELTLTDQNGSTTYGPGDRYETAPGTSHRAKGGPTVGRMIIGVKKES